MYIVGSLCAISWILLLHICLEIRLTTDLGPFYGLLGLFLVTDVGYNVFYLKHLNLLLLKPKHSVCLTLRQCSMVIK